MCIYTHGSLASLPSLLHRGGPPRTCCAGRSVRLASKSPRRSQMARRRCRRTLSGTINGGPPPDLQLPTNRVVVIKFRSSACDVPRRARLLAKPGRSPRPQTEKRAGPRDPLRRLRRRSASLKFGETSPGSPKSPEAKRPAAGDRTGRRYPLRARIRSELLRRGVRWKAYLLSILI